MLEGYFGKDTSADKHKRLLAVSAALEIAKASVGSSAGDANINKSKADLKHVAECVDLLANAIQAALDK